MDYGATTPVASEVEKAMRPYFSRQFGNPSSLHWLGQEASAAVFKGRRAITQAVGIDYRNVIFTGSATEANNLALRGVVGNCAAPIGKNQKRSPPKIIISAIEHESVLETARDLGKSFGVELVYLPVSRGGLVDLGKLGSALDERTILVSLQYANSEIGTIQPVRAAAEIIRNFRQGKTRDKGPEKLYPLFHCDAVQAFQFFSCRLAELGVDLLTLSAHKIYGPKGIGALCLNDELIANGYKLPAIITGGGQEWGRRSGTENVPAIAGFSKAVELAEKFKILNSMKNVNSLKELRDYFWRELKKIVPAVQLNGSLENRLPNNLNIYFPGRPAQDFSVELDLLGLAVSPGTACSARSAQASSVIKALGYDDDRPYSSLRFSLGRSTNKSELQAALAILKKRLT